MKKFLTNRFNICMRVTQESSTHYVCGNVFIPKCSVIEDLYPLDPVPDGMYALHIVPFYN